MIGGEGIVRPLLAAGFCLDDECPEWVVVGLDVHVTYGRLQRAMQALDRGAGFIGTNPDRRYPLETGFAPGCGALLAFLEAATGRVPHVVGKPNETMLEVALAGLGVAPASAAIIGDGLSTDIAAGRAAGLGTVLVLTGVTTAEEAAAARGTANEPDYVFDDLPALIAATHGDLARFGRRSKRRLSTGRPLLLLAAGPYTASGDTWVEGGDIAPNPRPLPSREGAPWRRMVP